MFHNMSITSSQSRMARAALGWSIRETAAEAHISINTLSRFEGGSGVFLSTANALRTAYQEAGVEFVGEGTSSLAGGAGVRLVAKVTANA
jgi:transcriptional regulator with XRE-family HTH domain